MNDRRVRLKEVFRRLGESKTTFYRRVREGKYPKPLRDVGMVFYLESMVLKLLGGEHR
jgi:predicted DNA-binding transcriptional regulator AlpA